MLPVMLQGCILKVTLMLHFSIAALGLSEKRVITLLLLLQAMLSSGMHRQACEKLLQMHRIGDG